MKIRLIVCLIGSIFFWGCKDSQQEMFRLIPPGESGVNFDNALNESIEFNIFNYMYFYNGAGVGIGDFNGDSLVDIYFTANQKSNKLYLNKGNFRFEDATEIAGVAGYDGWATGVSVADVNADGKLDIYVSYVGDYLIYNGKNQLFINEGNSPEGVPIFKDRSLEYGLDLVGFSTQAVFFDYDRDGDLDMFMLNHSLHQNGTFGNSSLRKTEHKLAGDKLLKNDNGHFIDVTAESGIFSSVIGYGLGVTVSDVNLDGWLDIYVGNDFHENDYLYINQGNGVFKEALESSAPHTSRYTMGVDFGDFNNDAFPDLIAMDMLPSDPQILKASQAEDSYDVYGYKMNFGYSHQFARNVLQLNNRNGTFSDIALMSGVAATDWSWSALFADFDLDGQKDIFVSNGIVRRSNDLDYINFITVDSIQMKLSNQLGERELGYIKQMPQIKIPNALFINNGDSTFTNRSAELGLGQPSYSNGTAYADLDNDGDLDLVVNNIDDKAFIYENLYNGSRRTEAANNFIQISLVGDKGNTMGIGSKVFIYQKGVMQMQECVPVRGYLSSVDLKLTFGLGPNRAVDSVVIVWPDGYYQVENSLTAGKNYTLSKSNKTKPFDYERWHDVNPVFKTSDEIVIPYKHEENKFVEFNREQLIPHMLSEEGPAVAIADVNGDKLDDLFLGGAKWQPGSLFIQNNKGQFILKEQTAFEEDNTYEDVDATFFNADSDSDLDLFVVSGGNEFLGKSQYRSPRLYTNDGKGNFTRSRGLPEIFMVGSCVAPHDIDGDGDTDLFLGARTTTQQYGIKPDSYILLNKGDGSFEEVTNRIAPALKAFGFVKKAVWADVIGDDGVELVLAGEWMPISIFTSKKGMYELVPAGDLGLDTAFGWWNSIAATDIDNDGDIDLVGGNLGKNSKLNASFQYPVSMYVKDFDKNGQVDQVLTYFINGREYPFHTRDEIMKQMPSLKKKYLSYRDFAKADVYDMFGEELKSADKFKVNLFHSSVFRNDKKSKFSVEPLPTAAQISPINSIVVNDFNDDGNNDLLLGGNFYPINIQMGRNDASYGALLLNKGDGRYLALSQANTGLMIKGEVRHILPIKVKDKIVYLVIKNDASVEILQQVNE